MRASASDRARGVLVALRLALAVLVLPQSIRAQAGDSARTAVASFRCLDTAARVAPARLDANHLIYAEQQTVVVQRDGRILVAGAPVWVWRDRGDRYEMLARDSLFGMIVDTSEFVRAIPRPFPNGVLSGMRAVALPDGWWMVSFAEVDRVEVPGRLTVLAMWVGETDGSRWRRLQQLPMVVDSLDVESSSLAWLDGRARLTVPFTTDYQRRIVLYSLDAGRWKTSTAEFGLLASATLRLTHSRDVLAVLRPVVDSVPDVNSLFLYSKRAEDSVWTERQLIVRSGSEPIFDPLFVGATRPLLSWRKSRNRQSEWDAWVAPYDEARDSVMPPVRLAEPAVEIAAAWDRDEVLWAISNRAWPNPVVQLVETDASLRIARLPRDTRYRGLFGLAITHGRAILIAAQSAATAREPNVVSMIETHTWRCP